MANITQTIQFSAPPQDVYELLIDEKNFAEFTDAKANINSTVGGKFSVWDDYASGNFVELQSNKKIIQTWRASDWPDGEVSEVTYRISAKNDGCELHFSQTSVPKEFAKEISKGWDDYYWSLMKKYLVKHNNV